MENKAESGGNELQSLLVLLREHGVSYFEGRGLRLKLAPISVAAEPSGVPQLPFKMGVDPNAWENAEAEARKEAGEPKRNEPIEADDLYGASGIRPGERLE